MLLPKKSVAALLGVLLPLTAFASGFGIYGHSGKTAAICTACHSVAGGTAPTVAFTGPAALSVGQTGTYTFTITGGPGVKGGMNVAVSGSAAILTAGTGQSASMNELTHASPQSFAGGTASWTFTLTAPATPGTVTLYGAGNSTDGFGDTGDRSAVITKVITIDPPANTAPTVATAAAATAASATTRALSVLGADDAGEAPLTYTWDATTAPMPVTFSLNGTNAARNTTASFTRAGNYVFTVTIKDAANLTVTSTVSVTIGQQLISIAAAPSSVGVAVSRTQQFTATGTDQFGNPVTPVPTWAWSASGGGTINATTGLYTAGAAAGGPFTVTAGSAGKTGTAQVTVSVGTPPTVATAAAAATNPVTSRSVVLSVIGADDGGEPALTYTWSVASAPAAVSYSVNATNAAKSTTATFLKAGSYAFMVTIKDATNLTISSNVMVIVNAQLQMLMVAPATAVVAPDGTKQFTVTANDQFGTAIFPVPTLTWTVPSAGGTVNAAGLFHAASTSGPFTVTATTGSKSATAMVTVTSGGAPLVATAPSATPANVVGKSTAIRVLGSDDGGEVALTYKWVGAGPGAVSFAENNSNAAKSTTATFSKAGLYTLTVTLQDLGGMTTTTTVEVTVSQSLTTLLVSPATINLSPNATQIFAAVAMDQFDDALGAAPTVAWVATGGGTIDDQGLLTARAAPGGPYTISAASNGVRGTAIVTIGEGGNDVSAPTVSIKAPIAGAVLSGATTLKVDATDNVGVTEVTWLLDGESLGVVSAAPFELVFQARSATRGAHVLEAIARDAAGNIGKSSKVSISIGSAGQGDLTGGCSSSAGSSPMAWAFLVGLGFALLGRARPRVSGVVAISRTQLGAIDC